MGGLRLQVAGEEAAAAEQILSSPIPENIAVAGEIDYQQPKCATCGSPMPVSTTSSQGRRNLDPHLGFPLASPVEKDYWHCHNCGCKGATAPTE